MAEKIININDTDQMINLFGTYDENINVIQRRYDVVVLSRGTDIKISGSEENVAQAAQAVEALMKIAKTGERVTEQTLRYVTSMVSEGESKQLDNLIGLNSLSFNPVISVPCIGIIVFAISIGISALLNHVPVVKKYM